MRKLIEKKLVVSLLPERHDNSNKSSFGKVLNIAGSFAYSGSAFLSSKSALKVGAGYVTLACPNEIIQRIAPVLPEVTYLPLESDKNGAISGDNQIEDLYNYDVVSVGCGLSTGIGVQSFVLNLLPKINSRQRLLIDADGINILGMHKGEFSVKNAVITPHPKELSRLLNVSVAEIVDNREKYARITYQTFECITVLKVHKTIVTNGEKIFVNTTGNSALAKAGTGDVLSGIISGFLAQKMSPLDASILGVYLHGLAGDIASDDYSQYSVLASDVIDYLPFAFNEILMSE